MIKMPEEWKKIIDNSVADNSPCLLATVSAEGQPSVGPKGSMQLFDDGHLAYWERTKRKALENLGANKNVMVYYRNVAMKDSFPGGAIRFYGTATLLEEGEVREKVMNTTVKFELDKDPDRKGVAVVIKVEKISDLGGNVIQE